MSNVVKIEVVRKTVYDELVAKVNDIDTSGFTLKTKYNAEKTELEKKIPDTSKLLKKSDYNAKISKIENEIPSISGLVTTSVLTAVENKIPNISRLVKKADYDTQRKLLIIRMTNILPLQKLMSEQQKLCCEISTSKFSNKNRF